MNLSDSGKTLLKQLECVDGKPNLVPYRDSGGVWTWGYGHACGPHEALPKSITESQAEAILARDVAWAVHDVNSILSFEPVPQNVFDALVCFVFNIGIAQLRAPPHRTLDAIQSRDWPLAGTRMMNWVFDNGKFVLGLENRRRKEVDLLLGRK